ncbi:hypothetical protein PV327_009743 [Microctonus hyperodae]|uniref:NADH dehydrogenase [ubiquinone] 1 alpha subcomplex assembly factor 2 n=1 Tax=Microctonus hyperodae TaxID=165561 RepID=A0AA39CBP4_MICHY|nr:hypothetical protein PV327_009743 [Microctonus hyperodae]
MVKERGVIVQVWRTFVASFKPKRGQQKFVGEDYNGTKYYEDPGAPSKRGRMFTPVDTEDFTQEMPAEWEAWLRYRRHEPPTNEEIKANYDLMMQKKSNAAQLEIEYAADRKEKYGDETKILEGASKEFPTYDDYKNHGQNYHVKKPK